MHRLRDTLDLRFGFIWEASLEVRFRGSTRHVIIAGFILEENDGLHEDTKAAKTSIDGVQPLLRPQ
jgi:hypothetical protein